MTLLLDDGDEQVGGHSAPDLHFHSVFARAQKALDAQMLLDPFEEQFHLPAALVQRGDDQRWQSRIVGQKDQRLARLRIFETDTPQMSRIFLRHVKTIHGDRLIADHAAGSVGFGRVHAGAAKVRTPASPLWRSMMMRPKVFHGTYSMTCANSVLPTFIRHPRSSKPKSIANIQSKIQIVDTHESLKTRFIIGLAAFLS